MVVRYPAVLRNSSREQRTSAMFHVAQPTTRAEMSARASQREMAARDSAAPQPASRYARMVIASGCTGYRVAWLAANGGGGSR